MFSWITVDVAIGLTLLFPELELRSGKMSRIHNPRHDLGRRLSTRVATLTERIADPAAVGHLGRKRYVAGTSEFTWREEFE